MPSEKEPVEPARDRVRLAASFPDSRTTAGTLDAARYRNRADLFGSIAHVEHRADSPPDFTVTVDPSARGLAPALRCEVRETGVYTRLALSVALDGLTPGDLLHLRWIARVPTPGPSLVTQIMQSQGGKGGKSEVADMEVTVPGDGEWREYYGAVVVGNVVGAFAHIVFALAEGSTLELAAVQAFLAGGRGDASLADGAAIVRAVGIHRLADPEGYQADTPPERYGAVVEIGNASLAGFAWSVAEPGGAALELSFDGEPAALGLASPLTSDAEPGAFSLRFDDRDAGARGSITFADGQPLRGSPFTIALATGLEGLAEIDGTSVRGWAIDRRREGEPVHLIISDAGGVLAEVVADQRHPILTGPGYNGGDCAFRYDIPRGVSPVGNISVESRRGGHLPGSPIPFTAPASGPEVQNLSLAGGRLTGRLVDAAGDSDGVIGVRIDDRPFGRIRADGPGPDGAGDWFSFPVPGQAQQVVLENADGSVLAAFAIDGGAVRPEPLSSAVRPMAAGATEIGLPDPDWYALVAGLDDGLSAAAAAAHWREQGLAQGLNPAPWFDETWYRQAHSGVAQAIADGAVATGFDHWLARGAAEGRFPAPGVRVDPTADDPLNRFAPNPHQPALTTDDYVAPTARTGSAVLQRLANPGRALHDAYVQRLVSDLSLTDPASAEALRASIAADGAVMAAAAIAAQDVEPLVSIIMPSFNRGFLIGEAIQSVLDQTWSNWELIVCDDGSTDKTPLVVARFDDPRIRYLKLEKTNGAVARNHGLRFARGDYIAFLDSDNLWHPLWLSAAVGSLHAGEGAWVYGGFLDTRVVGARFAEAELKNRAFDYQALLARNYIDLNGIVLDRVVYDRLGGFDGQLGRVQDWELVLRYGRISDPLNLPFAGVFYRRHEAWGQVTDLHAHTNFNDIVREGALEALATAIAPLDRRARRIKLTVAAGPGRVETQAAFALADLLRDTADVRLLVPSGAEPPMLLPGQAGDMVVYDTLASMPALLWGEAVIVTSDALERAADATVSVPVLRLRADDGLLLGPSGGTGQRIVLAEGDAPAGAQADRDERLFVLASAEAKEGWTAALTARSRNGAPAILALTVDDGLVEVSLFDRGRVQISQASAADVLAMIGQCDVAAVMAGAEREWHFALSVGAAALAAETVLVAVDDLAYTPWFDGKVAHRIGDVAPTRALEQVRKVLADTEGLSRFRRRGLRWQAHLHRRTAARERIELIVETVLARAEREGRV